MNKRVADFEGASKRQRLGAVTFRSVVLAVVFVLRLQTAVFLKQFEAAMIEPLNKTKRDDYPKFPNTDNNWPCKGCGTYKPAASFGPNPKHLNGLKHQCLECCRSNSKTYDRTLRGHVKYLMRHARSAAKDRGQAFTLTFAEAMEILNSQRGRCCYSGHRLIFRPLTSWSASLERLNDKVGYTKDNVVFVAQRFNTCGLENRGKYDIVGSAKWSKEKFQQVYVKVYETTTPEMLDAIAAGRTRPHGQYHGRANRKPDSRGRWPCTNCTQYKERTQFDTQNKKLGTPKSRCKKCINDTSRERKRTNPRRFIGSMLNDARKNNKDRSKKDRPLQFSITINYLMSILYEQKGLCAISHIPMNLRPCSDWKCSIERIDNRIGYVPGNVTLVCNEFNTADGSLNKGVDQDAVEGTAQWTRQLFLDAWFPGQTT